MKNIIYSTVLLSLMLMPCLLQAQDDMKQQGDRAYQDEDYQAAIEHYEALLGQGLESHELYYNLGCAYYRMNELGQAIVNFERALRLKPGDNDTEENLALCYNRTQDHIQQLPQTLIASWWHGFASLLTPHGWLCAIATLFAALCFAAAWFALSHSFGQRRGALIMAAAAILMLLAATGGALQSSHDLNSRQEAIVMRPMLNVKVSPDNGSNDKFALHEGTKVAIEETVGEWNRIRIADGNNGWVESTLIERI